MSWKMFAEHLYIILAAGSLSVLTGIPLGIAAYLYPRFRFWILKLTDLLQTIPALALLGLIMVLTGPGKVTVVIGITLYSLLPIVRNTLIGLQEVDAGIKEAARGMGMSPLYQLLNIEIPLAFPTILTGVRIAVVNAIGTAVFAAYVGGGGLGGVLNRGIRIHSLELILKGTAALMVLAFLFDGLIGWLEQNMQKAVMSFSKKVMTVTVILTMILLGGFAVIKQDQSAQSLILYDGDYTETRLMHCMVKLLVEEKTELKVILKDQMSQVNNFKALTAENPSCDMMVSYDGTVLTTFLHLDPADVPAGSSTFEYASQEALKKHGVYLLPPLGFDNTYAIAVPQQLAEKHGLQKISDLVPLAGTLRFGAEHEFFTQEGSMKYGPFTRFYGLHFQTAVPVDVNLKYTAMERQKFDVTEVYATDGLNRKAKLTILQDDKKFFPEYNGAFLVRKDLFTRFHTQAPELENVLLLLSGQISSADMVDMTYQVDVEKKTVEETAKTFLRQKGLYGKEGP